MLTLKKILKKYNNLYQKLAGLRSSILRTNQKGKTNLVRVGDHHVHVEEGIRQLRAEALHHRMAKGQVGHKMPIHYVLNFGSSQMQACFIYQQSSVSDPLFF